MYTSGIVLEKLVSENPDLHFDVHSLCSLEINSPVLTFIFFFNLFIFCIQARISDFIVWIFPICDVFISFLL